MMRADAARKVESAGITGFSIVHTDIEQSCVGIRNASYLIKST